MMYDKHLDAFSDEVVKVIYSKDRSMRYVVLKDEIDALLSTGKEEDAAEIFSQIFTDALPFMMRKLACRIDRTDGKVTVCCKNYCVKSLISEHEVLFAKKPETLANWNFVSVAWFQNY